MITYRHISTAFITNEPGKSIAAAVIILMSVLFVLQMTSLVTHGKNAAVTPRVANKGVKNTEIGPRSALFTKPLFGEYVPDPANAEIKQSRLDFVVVGIIYTKNKAGGEVILQIAGGKEKNFVVGDTLPGGAKIQRIDKSGIIVLYKGSLERLRLSEKELNFEKPPMPLNEE